MIGGMSNEDKTKYIVILMYSIIVVGIFMYISTKYYEESTRCSSMKNNYKDFKPERNEPDVFDFVPVFKNLKCSDEQEGGNRLIGEKVSNNLCNSSSDGSVILDTDNILSATYYPACLLNYHIKTAYNCCAVNTFKNSWVSECALIHCINAGARCLDFEIYSMNNNPVIGFSSRENNLNIKESFNKIDFHKAMSIINNTAFDSELTKQCEDFPVIINLRLKTKNTKVYDKIAKTLYQSFGDRLLDPKYSYNNDKKRLVVPNSGERWIHKMEGKEDESINIPLICRNLNSNPATDANANNDFNNKVIVIVNVTSLFGGKEMDLKNGNEFEQLCRQGGNEGILLDYMNLLSPSEFCMHLRDFEVENATDMAQKEYKNKSRQRLIFTTPTVGASSRNVDYKKHHENFGAQMVGMSFQNYLKDRPAALSQITQYHDFFNKKGLYSRKSDESSFNYTLTQDPTANPESNLTNAETAGDPTNTN